MSKIICARAAKTTRSSAPLLALLALAAFLPASAEAAIDYYGWLDPSDPTTWVLGTQARVGYVESGSGGSGTLIVDGGSDLLSGALYIAQDSSVTGSVTITGAGSTLTSNDNTYVGYRGNGSLTISDGAVVNGAGCSIGDYGTGAVTVSGGATWTNSGDYDQLSVGNYGTGTLNISGESTVTGASLLIGSVSGSSGSVTVSGAGTSLTTTSLYDGITVGLSGNGTLSITTGGTVSSAMVVVGVGEGSGSVEISGSGSTLTASSLFYVGAGFGDIPGTGATVEISDGGTVVSNNTDPYDAALIGYGSCSGQLSISGSGSSWTNHNDMIIGVMNEGTVTQTGGLVSNAGTIYISGDGYDTGTGTYNLEGGTLAIQGGIVDGGGTAAFNFGGGTLRADAAFSSSINMTMTGTGGNGTVDSNSYDVALSGNLTGAGGITKTGTGALTLTGANTYTGVTTVQEGSLVLGLNAHNPVFNNGGADVQAAGKLVFDYAGGSTPITSVRGNLFSGKIFSSDATGSHGLGYADDGSSQVRVEYALYGDSDLDGAVDGLDLTVAIGSYTGSSGTGKIWADGDSNYDGAVDGLDLTTAIGNYTGSVASTTAALLAASSADVAELIYDPTTGNVKLDAGDGTIVSFYLKNAVGGDDFITDDVNFPFNGMLHEASATVISDTDGTYVGFTGEWDLGDIFVTGLDEESLSAWLTTAVYTVGLGSGTQSFNLTVVPEPGTLALLACGLFGILAYAWRKRK